MVVGLVRVVVGPGSAVPVSTYQDTVRGLRQGTGNDVAGRNLRAVIQVELHPLFHHAAPITSELLYQIVPTLSVCLCPGHAGTESTLLLDMLHGTVCHEGRT